MSQLYPFVLKLKPHLNHTVCHIRKSALFFNSYLFSFGKHRPSTFLFCGSFPGNLKITYQIRRGQDIRKAHHNNEMASNMLNFKDRYCILLLKFKLVIFSFEVSPAAVYRQFYSLQLMAKNNKMIPVKTISDTPLCVL